MSLFLLPGSEHAVGREFFICEDAAFVTPVCPRLAFGNAVRTYPPRQILHTASQGRFDKILLCSHEDGLEQRLSSTPRQVSNFCGVDKSTIPPVYLQVSTTLYRPSWAAVHNNFFLSAFSLPLYIFFRWSRSVTTTVNKSQRRQAFACRLF